MSLSKSPYKGTRDFFPSAKRRQDYLFDKMRSVAESFGYEPYNGPLLESVELYRAKSGQELIDEQIYSFTDRGRREVAIRPEMTPTLARMVAQVHKETPKPIRWYSIPNLYRYERPQKGRLREHWQFNCDVFGAPDGKGDIEILLLITEFLKSFGATENDFEILINDRRLVDAVFFKLLKIDTQASYELYKIIDKSKKIDAAALVKLLETTTLNQSQITQFFEYLELKSFEDVIDFCKMNEIDEECQTFITFLERCDQVGLAKFMKYDPAIVRGLDYYTGVVFEVFDKSPENRRAICGGGTYSNLLQIFDEPQITGVGFGMGDVTLVDFLETHNLLPSFNTPPTDIFITFQHEKGENAAWVLANHLRKKINAEVHLEPIRPKKVFNIAEKKNIPFVIFIGEDEIADKSIQVKNLRTKESKTISVSKLNDLFDFIKG